jgi:hypothetical protein
MYMKKIVIEIIIFVLLLTGAVFLVAFILGKTGNKFDDFVPNIVTMIFQIIILGLLIYLIEQIKSYRKKRLFFNSIKAILAEPLKRFNEPNNETVDLDNDNFGNTIDLAKKNIRKVELNNYYELINIMLTQRNAINGLLLIALQISEVHAWMINGLICVHTRLIDEIEKIFKNNGIMHYNQIKDKALFDDGFNGIFEIYLNDCKQFLNTEKKIKP